MDKNLRKAVIAGNWKMHKTPEEALDLIIELMPLVKKASAKVIICPPSIDLHWLF